MTITGDNSVTDRIEIDTIELNITADEDVFLPDGGMLSEQLKEPGVLMDAWDIQYAGLENAATEDILVDGSDDEYVLKFTDGDGKEISLTLVSAVAGTTISSLENPRMIWSCTRLRQSELTTISSSAILEEMGKPMFCSTLEQMTVTWSLKYWVVTP